ncbi:helix-turn-helix domain-containing protein [Klebsiella pneumoniae]|uniref:helix-turn-helix domain-containing protein n=1 Tax=Klebsiella pneumoniae TaxID=573 RepID=UPI001430B08E
MLIQKAYKYRLNPTDAQAQRLRQMCGCARFVWNYALAETQRILEAGRKLPSAFELNKMLTGWKKLPELAFLSDAYTDNLQQKLKTCTGHGNGALIKSWQRKRPCLNIKATAMTLFVSSILTNTASLSTDALSYPRGWAG